MHSEDWAIVANVTFSDIIAVISILAAIIFPFWLYGRNLRDRLVEIVHHPVSDLTQALKQNGIDFSVTYAGKTVNSISSLEILVGNQGKFPIKDLEIHVFTIPSCELLGSSIQSEEELITNSFSWLQGAQQGTGYAKIPYMNPHTNASLSFHFSGTPERVQIEPKTPSEYKADVKSYDKWLSGKNKFQNSTIQALVILGVILLLLSYSIINNRPKPIETTTKFYYDRVPPVDAPEVDGGKKDLVQ